MTVKTDNNAPFSLSRSASADEVAATIAEQGVAVIDGLLPDDEVDRLAAECRVLFEDTASWVNPEDYSLGAARRLVRSEIDRDRYPSLLAAFESPFLERIATLHYGPKRVFAEKIYVILDVVGSRTIVQELHYDKVEHLKLFFYLTDVGLGNGPFYCVPGSHKIAKSDQADNRRRGVIPTNAEARVLPDELHRQELPVLGRRGTLIAFDSDIAHRASAPTEGPRLAARSLSFGPHSLGERV
jgi:hypothetical protein